TARMKALGIEIRLNAEATADTLKGFDEVVVATGVKPRIPSIEGINHPKAVSYADVLNGTVTPGNKVAVIGAGGIGVDVSVWLTHRPEELDEWLAHWGVGESAMTEGALVTPKAREAAREVWLLQRKTSFIGKDLGKTSGWAHREVLKQSGVHMLTGVTYDRIDDAGLHITVDGKQQVLDVDQVVICAGQESVRGLHDELAAQGRAAALIGGADVAAELDAKRAIKQGVELAARA
ncbi:MAG TPA: FAD-dependent oxidoreductase, partial [Marmoricola sp.]|nr:FAD-dependent oxidoreductase [Marmoricola sp.]